MSTLTFLGSGGAFCALGRGNSCYWVEDEAGVYMVDCGPTAPLALKRLSVDVGQIDGLLLTHLHGDHIGGFPLLLLTLCFSAKRTRPLEIIGPPGSERRLDTLMRVSYPELLPEKLPFALEYRSLSSAAPIEWRGRELSAIDALHDPNVEPLSIRVDGAGTALTFSGDTGWQPALATLAAGSTLICECSYADPVFPGHISVAELIAARESLTCDRLVLTHLGADARAAAINAAEEARWEVGDDGLVLSLSR